MQLDIKALNQDLAGDSSFSAIRNALSRLDPSEVLLDRSVFTDLNHVFSHKIERESKCSNQRSSGRCWLFAALNVMRTSLMRKYDLPSDFELSQSYLFFFDKLEKANIFLEQIIETASEPLAGRLMMHLLESPLSDGGQWDMFVNLVQKYGVVPQSAYPESEHSSKSLHLRTFLSGKVREYAMQLRNAASTMRQLYTKQCDDSAATAAQLKTPSPPTSVTMPLSTPRPGLILSMSPTMPTTQPASPTAAPVPSQEENERIIMEQLRTMKAVMIQEVYRVLALHMGVPPVSFEWVLREKGTYKRFEALTPLRFFKEFVGDSTLDKVCLIHAPTADKPLFRRFTVQYLNNMQGGRPVNYVNVPIDVMKRCTFDSIVANEAVWFGCDVGKHFHRSLGLLDMNVFSYQASLGTAVNMDKAARMDYGHSKMSHAMSFTAVDVLNMCHYPPTCTACKKKPKKSKPASSPAKPRAVKPKTDTEPASAESVIMSTTETTPTTGEATADGHSEESEPIPQEVVSAESAVAAPQETSSGDAAVSVAPAQPSAEKPPPVFRKWRVENSWGERAGDKGYLVMGDSWFTEYVYEVVVDKRHLPAEVLAVLEQDPVVLPPWDPMGNLASK